MIAANDFYAFCISAETGHVAVLELLLAELNSDQNKARAISIVENSEATELTKRLFQIIVKPLESVKNANDKLSTEYKPTKDELLELFILKTIKKTYDTIFESLKKDDESKEGLNSEEIKIFESIGRKIAAYILQNKDAIKQAREFAISIYQSSVNPVATSDEATKKIDNLPHEILQKITSNFLKINYDDFLLNNSPLAKKAFDATIKVLQEEFLTPDSIIFSFANYVKEKTTKLKNPTASKVDEAAEHLPDK